MPAFLRRWRCRLGRAISRLPAPIVAETRLTVPATVSEPNAIPSAIPAASVSRARLPDCPACTQVHLDALRPAALCCVQAPPLSPRETRAASDPFETPPTVSGNLVDVPDHPSANGKRYGPPEEEGEADPRRGYRRSFLGDPADRFLKRPRGPDAWDLMLPVLQPAVDADFRGAPDLAPTRSLRPYQRAGVAFLVGRRAAVLGDVLGAGKTVQCAMACRTLFQRGAIDRALIVVRSNVLQHWDAEMERWAPALRTTVVTGPVERRRVCWTMPAHVYITSYGHLVQDIDYLAGSGNHRFGLAVLDAPQRVERRSPHAPRATRRLDAVYRWALTSAPIDNDIPALSSVLAFLDPELLSGDRVSPEQARSLTACCLLRRRIVDVTDELPGQAACPVWLRLNTRQQRAYDDAERRRVTALAKQRSPVAPEHILALIRALQEICNLDPGTGESAKRDWLTEAISDICASGDKAVVFTQFREPRFGGADWLADQLAEFGALNYGAATSDRRKQDVLRAFELAPGKRVLIGHPRVLGPDVEQLAAANYAVHFDHWPIVTAENDATAQAGPSNRTKQAIVHRLWVKDTIDEAIHRATSGRQDPHDQTSDRVAASPSVRVLLDVCDALLTKHGFPPLRD